MTRDERIAKHGKAWRYVFLLERELARRKTRQRTLRASLALSAALILFIIGAYIA